LLQASADKQSKLESGSGSLGQGSLHPESNPCPYRVWETSPNWYEKIEKFNFCILHIHTVLRPIDHTSTDVAEIRIFWVKNSSPTAGPHQNASHCTKLVFAFSGQKCWGGCPRCHCHSLFKAEAEFLSPLGHHGACVTRTPSEG